SDAAPTPRPTVQFLDRTHPKIRCVEDPQAKGPVFGSCTPNITTTVTVLHSQHNRHPKVTHRTVSALETPPRQRHCAEGGGAQGEHPATLGSGGLAGGRCV